MIDYGKELVAVLNTVLPTHHELALHSGLSTPCISWMELTNVADVEGDTIGYSRPQFQVKVWANDIATIQRYAVEVDRVLRPLGLKRTGTNELFDKNSTMIQKIMTYSGLAVEEFI